jgi:hypothetical protein
MSRRWAQILLSIASLAVVAHSQSTASNSNDLLPDEDGGQVRVVRAESDTIPVSGKPAAIRAPKQVSIFYGGGWAQEATRLQEHRLTNLLSNATSAHQSEMAKSGVRAVDSQFSYVEDFTDLSTRATLTDLGIQRQIDTWMNSGEVPAPSGNTVYVVYLGPGVNSTLRGKIGGHDYLGYYSLVHLGAGAVVYAVVQYDAETQRMQHTATQLLIEAAIDPPASK